MPCSEPSYEDAFEHLLHGGELWSTKSTSGGSTAAIGDVPGCSKEQLERLSRLASLPAFQKCADVLRANGEATRAWLLSDTPEREVPAVWTTPKPLTAVGTAVNSLLLVHALRPDRFLATAHSFIAAVFNDQFVPQAERVLNLQTIVEQEVRLGC